MAAYLTITYKDKYYTPILCKKLLHFSHEQKWLAVAIKPMTAYTSRNTYHGKNS